VTLARCRRARPAPYQPARCEVVEPSTPTRIDLGPSVPARTAVPRLVAQQQCMDRRQPGPMAAQPQRRRQHGRTSPGTSTGGITPPSPGNTRQPASFQAGTPPARPELPTVLPEAHGSWLPQAHMQPDPELADMRSRATVVRCWETTPSRRSRAHLNACKPTSAKRTRTGLSGSSCAIGRSVCVPATRPPRGRLASARCPSAELPGRGDGR
jgi:hypothetical protein